MVTQALAVAETGRKRRAGGQGRKRWGGFGWTWWGVKRAPVWPACEAGFVKRAPARSR